MVAQDGGWSQDSTRSLKRRESDLAITFKTLSNALKTVKNHAKIPENCFKTPLKRFKTLLNTMKTIKNHAKTPQNTFKTH